MTDDLSKVHPTEHKAPAAGPADRPDDAPEDHRDDLEKLDPEKLVEDALQYFSEPYPADQPPVHP